MYSLLYCIYSGKLLAKPCILSSSNLEAESYAPSYQLSKVVEPVWYICAKGNESDGLFKVILKSVIKDLH